jgi:inhibitor of KinA
MNPGQLTISPLGDSAILINFGNKIDETLNRKVLHLFHGLKNEGLPFVKDIVPAYSSLVIIYDLLIMVNKTSVNKSVVEMVTDRVKKILDEDIKISPLSMRKIKIPVCYAVKFGWDLEEIAAQKNLTVEEIIHIHTLNNYRVYMTGFLPGFPYMGEVDERIAVPRRDQPRITVEAGSVGIAGRQTGIYPLDSPGGWQIIGKTPLALFNKEWNEPVLLQPGDEIKFYPITENEFRNYKNRNT